MIVAYDCTSEESFNNVRNWVRQVEAHTNGRENVEAVLIGNKSDLTDRKVIETEQGQALAKEFGMDFFETSARTGQNVQETFITITKKIKDKLASKEATVPSIDPQSLGGHTGQVGASSTQSNRESIMLTGKQHKEPKKEKKGGCCGGKK